MENIIKVPVKPIIKQFLISKIGDPCPVYQIPDYALAFYSSFTERFENRYCNGIDGLVDMNIKVSKTYRNCFVDSGKIESLTLHIERVFWKDAKIEILSNMSITKNKSFAMRKFYTDHNITEEQYSQDNFYRQLTRMKINNERTEGLTRNRFNCVTNSEAREIAHLFYKQKVSCRQIANHFGIHHKTVSRIVKKVRINIS